MAEFQTPPIVSSHCPRNVYFIIFIVDSFIMSGLPTIELLSNLTDIFHLHG